MGEEGVGVGRGDRVEGRQQRLERPGGQPPQVRFKLGEGMLDRVEVGRVGRQEQQPAAYRLDQMADPLALVRAQVVQHHYLAGAQVGQQRVGDVGVEDQAVGRTLERQPIVAI
jgi:hypothetical protein